MRRWLRTDAAHHKTKIRRQRTMQQFMQGFALRGTLAMAALAALAGCASTDSGWATPSDTGLSADISRTAFGIPHIRANDYASLGYGMAYAYAQDNVCLLADQVVTVNGERSKTFGPEGTVTVSFK